MTRNEWADEIRTAIRLFDYEKALLLLASNYRDKGDLDSLIENFCSEADPLTADFTLRD